jgi:hypothetical protein
MPISKLKTQSAKGKTTAQNAKLESAKLLTFALWFCALRFEF